MADAGNLGLAASTRMVMRTASRPSAWMMRSKRKIVTRTVAADSAVSAPPSSRMYTTPLSTQRSAYAVVCPVVGATTETRESCPASVSNFDVKLYVSCERSEEHTSELQSHVNL